ncbi:hypothetical protein HPC49_31720 [Pyxidicoccus fallax]|uniref:Lipoprotein n=1 Tax=Pyxidicoccus fallax TaxID=394095 RepID=A0A848LPE1_9BACT|nr:hypothetical protein [Pyxidicoccus fallax]NMO19530.1 hypothetical protein [Pyxidicoccus fallax]NPC82779.1 hypothetical protein [Pyxidicoccus fallax]
MRKTMKSLLSAAALLALAPTAALALPPQCDEACGFDADCGQICAAGRYLTNCGEYGICGGFLAEPSAEQASLTQDEAAQVCSEEQQHSEPSAES